MLRSRHETHPLTQPCAQFLCITGTVPAPVSAPSPSPNGGLPSKPLRSVNPLLYTGRPDSILFARPSRFVLQSGDMSSIKVAISARWVTSVSVRDHHRLISPSSASSLVCISAWRGVVSGEAGGCSISRRRAVPASSIDGSGAGGMSASVPVCQYDGKVPPEESRIRGAQHGFSFDHTHMLHRGTRRQYYKPPRNHVRPARCSPAADPESSHRLHRQHTARHARPWYQHIDAELRR
jgi:hypothetical protein